MHPGGDDIVAPHPILNPERLLKAPEEYGIWEIKNEEGKRQLLLTLSATLPDHSRTKIMALIDTGAEANLIKKRADSSKNFKTRPQPPGASHSKWVQDGRGYKGSDLATMSNFHEGETQWKKGFVH